MCQAIKSIHSMKLCYLHLLPSHRQGPFSPGCNTLTPTVSDQKCLHQTREERHFQPLFCVWGTAGCFLLCWQWQLVWQTSCLVPSWHLSSPAVQVHCLQLQSECTVLVSHPAIQEEPEDSRWCAPGAVDSVVLIQESPLLSFSALNSWLPPPASHLSTRQQYACLSAYLGGCLD